MKSIVKIIQIYVIVVFVGICLYSCNSEHERVLPSMKGPVAFGFSPKDNQNGRVSTIEAEHIMVSIADANGETVLTDELLNITPFGESYLSESIELEAGTYTLTLFAVLNSDGEIAYASPVEGSEKAELVTNPLPLQFEVENGNTSTVVPQVVAVGETDDPADFGYAAFSFEIIEPVANNLKINIYEKTSATDSIPLSGTIIYISSSEGYYVTHMLPSHTHSIPLPDKSFVNIAVEKDGYSPSITSYLNVADHADDTLIITLNKLYPVDFELDLEHFPAMDTGYLTVHLDSKAYYSSVEWNIGESKATASTYLPEAGAETYEVIAYFFSQETDEVAFSLGSRVDYGSGLLTLSPFQTYQLHAPDESSAMEWSVYTGNNKAPETYEGTHIDLSIVASNDPLCDHFYRMFLHTHLSYLFIDVDLMDITDYPIATTTREAYYRSAGYYLDLSDRSYSEEDYCGQTHTDQGYPFVVSSIFVYEPFIDPDAFDFGLWQYQTADQ